MLRSSSVADRQAACLSKSTKKQRNSKSGCKQTCKPLEQWEKNLAGRCKACRSGRRTPAQEVPCRAESLRLLFEIFQEHDPNTSAALSMMGEGRGGVPEKFQHSKSGNTAYAELILLCASRACNMLTYSPENRRRIFSAADKMVTFRKIGSGSNYIGANTSLLHQKAPYMVNQQSVQRTNIAAMLQPEAQRA